MTDGPDARLHSNRRGRDKRDEFQRDRDRVLYSSAFRRLAGVTQVVGVAEGHVFHNRLTHSLKVAQVARRIAEMLEKRDPKKASELWIYPEAVEAAALAHDLGHPPFGHVGEATLNECMSSRQVPGGFEGNAQSFRIVGTLAMRREDAAPGLNLTRATLTALLKYPWVRTAEGPHARKWGSYESEHELLRFARRTNSGDEQSAGARVMDYADDITYSVHDIEDFYRAGMVPLDRLLNEGEQERFVLARFEETDRKQAHATLQNLLGLLTEPLRHPFTGTRTQRGALRGLVSTLVERYVLAVEFDDSSIGVSTALHHAEIDLLKNVMRHYVFEHPAIAAQQYGQREVLKRLFAQLLDLTSSEGMLPKSNYVMPVSMRDALAGDVEVDESQRARVVCDTIASMTEQQVLGLAARLSGESLGSIQNRIVY